MFSSFFGKSTPINFVLAAGYILVFYLIADFDYLIKASFWEMLKEVFIFGVLILSLFLLNFISGKNELTGRNAYKTMLFAGFICMFLPLLQNNAVILSNFFVLLSLRRVVSLRSQRETTKKIFDATLWVGVASLFYFWSILFLLPIYFGILVHVGHRFRNWLVPLVGILCLVSISTSIDLLLTDSFFSMEQWYDSSLFDFKMYREPRMLVAIAFLFSLSLWSLFFYFLIIRKASGAIKPSLFLIFLYAIIAIGVAICAPAKNGSELIFFFAPLSLIVTNYFQTGRDNWFQDLLFLIVMLLPAALILL